jgi:RES domain-containing protein
MHLEDSTDQGVTWVGFALEVVRISDPVYVDQAAHDFAGYVTKTLSASQRHGGRYNRPGEFGALYTASDFDTALAEITSRYAREGVPGLPEMMGLIRILIRGGRYVDLSESDVQEAWNADARALAASAPTPAEMEHCWEIASAIRAVADFLKAPSAQGDGENVPIFPDREAGELQYQLQSTRHVIVPPRFVQQPSEEW